MVVVGKQIVLVQHEGIVTRDAEKSKDFYVGVLGLEVLPRPPLQSFGYWLGAPGSFPQIHIIQSDAPVPGPDAPINPRARHTCFEVTDYEALKATLRGDGIQYVENVQPGGCSYCATTRTVTPWNSSRGHRPGPEPRRRA